MPPSKTPKKAAAKSSRKGKGAKEEPVVGLCSYLWRFGDLFFTLLGVPVIHVKLQCVFKYFLSRGQILKEIAALEANLPQQHKTKEEIIREMQLLESRIEHLQTAGLSAIVCLFPSDCAYLCH